MDIFSKRTPLEKEWSKLEKQEREFRIKRQNKRASKLEQLLEEKVPPKLQETLDKTFAKAFQIVFEKGTGVIEKIYRKNEKETKYQINNLVEQRHGTRKSLKVFSKSAKSSGRKNTAFSYISGVGLGFLGIGIPDIVLFIGTLLKSIYEIAISYGYDYTSPNEQKFILNIIRGGVAHGDAFSDLEYKLNLDISDGIPEDEAEILDLINATSEGLSGELLYMKFVQGIPVVGAVGGFFDGVYMRNITKYAELKYRRRFYMDKKNGLK